MRKYIFFLIFFIAFFYGFSEKVKVSIDKNKLKIGEELKLTFGVKGVKNLENVVLDKGGISGFLIKRKEIKKNLDNITISFYITTFDLKRKKIGPFNLKIFLNGGKTKILKVDKTFDIQVISSLKKDDKDIKDIKNPLNIKFDYKTLVLLIVIFVMLIFLLYYFIKFIKRKFSKKGNVEEVFLLPPYDEFLKHFKEIEPLIEKGHFREFYFKFSEIVRRYLERRVGILFLERTTSEILRDMEGVDLISGDLKGEIEKFLRKSEPIKYAGFIPHIDELKKFRELGKKIVSEMERIFKEREELEEKVD